MTAACPHIGELERLLANDLSAEEEKTLEAHVIGCPACQARLEQLTTCRMSLDRPPDGSVRGPARVLEQVARIPPAQARLLEQSTRPAPVVARAGNSHAPSAARAPKSAPPVNPSGSTGLSTLRATGNFFRHRYWVWPLVAALLLGAAGWWVNGSVESAMRQQRINELTTVVEADVAALRVWMDHQHVTAELVARDEQLRPLVRELLALADGSPASERQLVHAKAQSAVRSRLAEPLLQGRFIGFMLVSPAGIVIAADQDAAVGKSMSGYGKAFAKGVVEGRATVSKPFLSPLLLVDENGQLQANLPVMAAAAPVRDEGGKPIASLSLRIRAEGQFTRILRVARSGETGETYAFDRNGLFLSQSRFEEDLKQIGLLVNQPGSRSILSLEVRDPGVDMVRGERPQGRRSDQPLTRMASEAVQGQNGHDADGYRDYRGVPVVGAWRWLDEYDFGVATEMDVAEAFRPVYLLRRAFWVLIALLVASALAIFLGSLFIARQQRALQQAALAVRQLGQYTLVERLGAGGMGTVYKARHALLRRPTAIKLLNPDQMSDSAIARFEREVQLTSGLTHPNTVSIFDYGRTPDGDFYYVMEYLEGITLEDLVRRCGAVPEARVVSILRQICGSLAEAHAAGLVHRDIKPANIFLTCRGGLHDFVKVLDFGLVKALDHPSATSLTSPNTVAGTPQYLAPESVSNPALVDARADVYAIGAVGYYLLTGSPVFSGDSTMEICLKHVQAAPEPPSIRCGRPLNPELEALLLRCLAKLRQDRPSSAADLLHELEACPVERRWTVADAAMWWVVHGPGALDPERDATPSSPVPSRPTRLDDVAVSGPPI